MKECSVKMESRVSEIQIETKDEKGPVAVCPQEERQQRKTATLCFKRRKKANKMKPKAASKTAGVTKKHPPEAGASDQPQPAGAWASIKRLVTHRKRSGSSEKQKPSEAEGQPEDKAFPKKKAKSRLRIPCIRFSRGTKRSHPSKLTDDSDYLRVQGGADDLEIKTQTQSADQAKSTQGPQESGLVEGGKEAQESHVSNSITSRENVISVELELENEASAIQMGTPVLEKETKGIKEKPSVQEKQASPEADSSRPAASDVPASQATAYQRGVEEPSGGTQESAPSRKDDRSAAEEKKSGETALSQAQETTLSQAEEAAVSQADKSAVAQTEEVAMAQTEETAVARAEEATVAQVKETAAARAEEATVAQVKETAAARAEEATVAQVKETAAARAEEATVAQVKTAAARAEEATVAQVKETAVVEEGKLRQAEVTTVTQVEEAPMAQVEEGKLSQAEEATMAQTEEVTVAQVEETAVAQAEEAAVAQVEEGKLSQAEEAARSQAEEAARSQAPDLKENGIDAEKPKSEESKRMEPIAIIITDTEISEFDVKKSKNVPKQFLMSMENEQVGVFANDSDFKGRTSEQYETLLIETASSLVKNAIQLSVEQLVNEMVSEDNKINTLLQ